MDCIEYSTVQEQIQMLKQQNLIIENEDFARDQLLLYGYSNLIKSYRDPYVITENGNTLFRDGVTFEQIQSLYMFDKNLRNAVMASMLDFEEYIKEAAADVISKSFGTREDDYLNFRNYRNKKKHIERFTLPSILHTMRETLKTDKNPINYYSQNHGMVPPWILYKSIYFGTMVNYIDLFKRNEQVLLAKKMYSISKLTEDESIQLMMDTLFTCMNYRNRSAHGGRIYDFNSKTNIRLVSPDKNQPQNLSKLLFVLSCLDYKAPYQHLHHSLSEQLNRHCSSFPSDMTYLGQILRVNITVTEYVFVGSNRKIYHSDPHCSGIHDPLRLELSDAVEAGYIPCKKCARRSLPDDR